jgi:hypothetical protein
VQFLKKVGHMKAIDRVTYGRKHQLTEAQTSLVRRELSAFIDELLAGKQLEDRIWPSVPKPANP